jgi:hypothetical protein
VRLFLFYAFFPPTTFSFIYFSDLLFFIALSLPLPLSASFIAGSSLYYSSAAAAAEAAAAASSLAAAAACIVVGCQGNWGGVDQHIE